MKASKTTSLIIICVVAAVVAVALVVGVSLALWEEMADDTRDMPLNVDDYNASEPYIIFQGLDADGLLTSDNSAAVSWAVVGYRGLVAEVVIPATHSENADGSNALPVTHILVSPDYMENRLAGNPVITSLTVPSSVVGIGAGVCSGMQSLQTLSLQGTDGDEAIAIGDMAFAGCGRLSQFNCNRNVVGDEESFLMGTPYRGQ